MTITNAIEMVGRTSEFTVHCTYLKISQFTLNTQK